MSQPKKKSLNGQKKSIILLNLLGNQLTKKVYNYLSSSEKKKLKQYQDKNNTTISTKDEKKVLNDFLKYMKDNETSFQFDLALIFVLVCLLVSISFISFAKSSQPLIMSIQDFLRVGGAFLILFPVVLFIIKSYYKYNIIQLITSSENRIRDTFYALTGGIILYFILIFSNVLFKSDAIREQGSFFIISIIVGGFIGPITEEFFLRKIIYTLIKEKTNIFLAFIGSSFLFALIHLKFHPLEFFFYFLAGLILAFLFEKTKNLYSPILAHSISNLMIIILGNFL